jgi:senataxin
MKSTDDIYDSIMENYHKLEEIPPNIHLLCPKVGEHDTEDYESPDEPGTEIDVKEKQSRIESSKTRQSIMYQLCLLLGLDPEQAGAWLADWTKRLEGFLTTCDRCIVNWHRGRAPFLKTILEYAHLVIPCYLPRLKRRSRKLTCYT